MDWDERYKSNDTPWNKFGPAPELVHFLDKNYVNGRVLVPGCGFGYDAADLAKSGQCRVMGLDISMTAIVEAHLRHQNVSQLEFHQGDIFNPFPELINAFDWVFEHTCFCAIEPEQRRAYVDFVHDSLREGGHYLAIMFRDTGSEDGPPYSISAEEVQELFGSRFKVEKQWEPETSFPGREDSEFCWLMRKK
jgi:SAM-dependent methyltransferase